MMAEAVMTESGEKATIEAEDGRELYVPKTTEITVVIGRKMRADKNYVTDELMEVTTHESYLIDSIPHFLDKYVSNPSVSYEQGDIKGWETPAGQHPRANKVEEILEDAEEVTNYTREDNRGHHDKTHFRVQVDVQELQQYRGEEE